MWDDKYSVGVKEIDEQYQQFFVIINQIYDLLDADEVKKEEVLKILTELGNYALFHLGSEEEYFEKFQYEEAEIHTNIHNQFRDKVKKSLAQVNEVDESGLVDLVLAIMKFTREWLVNHIMIEDKKYTKCFNGHGLN